MASIDQSADDHSLLSSAESRIDAALAQLLMAARGGTDSSRANELAVTELRKARDTIRAMRERINAAP